MKVHFSLLTAAAVFSTLAQTEKVNAHTNKPGGLQGTVLETDTHGKGCACAGCCAAETLTLEKS